MAAALALWLPAMAASAPCPPGEVSASTGGVFWGTLTTEVTETDGKKFRVRTNETSGDGIATSIAQAWVPAGTVHACDVHVGISMPSVPGRTPRSFSWGEAQATASVTIPRAGLMRGGVTTDNPELLNGEHNGQVGAQVAFLIDGVAVPTEMLQLNDNGRYGHSFEVRVGAGLHSLQLRAKNVRKTPFDFFPPGGDLRASGTFRIFVDQPRVGDVKDVDRFGQPGAGLAGAGVRLLSNGSLVASTTTGADGGFNFTGIDTAQLFDLQIDHGELVRTYQAISLSSLASTALTLPVTLRARLDAELTKLENTPPLVTAYRTTAARTLTQNWNTAQPELASVHIDRNLALARLLVASEGLAGLFTETAPVATDTAKLTVDTITTLMSLRKVMDEVGAQAGRRAGQLAGEAVGTAALRRLNLALEFLFTALELGSEKLQAVVVDAVRSVLPGWAADLFEQGLKATTATVLEAMSSGEWSGSDARAGLLESVTTELASQVGGRVLASGYVGQTDQDLRLAEIKARSLSGSGAPVDAFAAVQTRVIDVSVRHQELIALNAALGDTAKGWSTVADLSLLVGRRPGGQLIASIGAVVKAISAGALVGLSVANYHALYDTAFDEAPLAVSGAFDAPSAKSAASRRTPLALLRLSKALAPEYADRLAALRAAIANGTDATWVDLGEHLLAADAELNATIQHARLHLQALARDAGREALNRALSSLFAAEGLLAGERIVLYAHLSGLLEPEFADPAVTADAILAQIDAVSAALTQLETALAAAQTEADGLTAPASVFVENHGLDSDTARTDIGPGPIVLRAEIVNAGDAPTSALSVALELGVDAGAPLQPTLDGPAQQDIAALAPGERLVLRWRGNTGASGMPELSSIVGYRIALLPRAARGQSASGAFAVVPAKDRIFRGGFEP